MWILFDVYISKISSHSLLFYICFFSILFIVRNTIVCKLYCTSIFKKFDITCVKINNLICGFKLYPILYKNPSVQVFQAGGGFLPSLEICAGRHRLATA